MSNKDKKIIVANLLLMLVTMSGGILLNGLVGKVSTIIFNIILMPLLIYIVGKFIKQNDDKKIYKKFFVLYVILSFILIFFNDKIFINNIINKMLNNSNFSLLFLICAYSVILPIFKGDSAIHYSICTAIIVSLMQLPNVLNRIFYYLPFAAAGYNSLKLEVKDTKLYKVIGSVFGIFAIYIFLDVNVLLNYNNDFINQSNNLLAGASRILMYNCVICFISTFYKYVNKKSKNINIKFSNLIILGSFLSVGLKKILNNLSMNYTLGMKTKIIYLLVFVTVSILAILFLLLGKKEIKKENNKLKVNEKSNIYNWLLPLGLIIIIFLKQVLFAYQSVNLNMISSKYYSLLYISEGILLILPIFLFKKNKNKFNYALILDGIFTFIIIANLWYFRYQSNLISINQLQNARYVKEIFRTLVEIVKVTDFIYLIDIVALLIFREFIVKNIVKYDGNQNMFLNFIYVIILFLISNSNRYSGFKFINDFPFASIRSKIEVSSIIGYYINDINLYLNREFKYNTLEECIAKYKNYKNKYEQNEKYTGIAKDKNVIIVQLEAVQNFLLNAKINGKEITPNINKFIEENVKIANMHAQSYTTTADSEFSFSTGILPLENGMSFSMKESNEYNDLYSVLQKNGYYTSFAHGNIPDFWNRKKVYEAFGVDKTLYMEDFKNEKNIFVNSYLLDEDVYDQTVDYMKKYQKKYLQVISTASSHTPFKLEGMPEEYRKNVVNIDVGKYKNTMFGNYLEACNYADYSFAKFIEKLKKEGMYDDTVIMIFGDHYGIPVENKELHTYFKEEKGINVNKVIDKYNFTNVLAGIKLPGVDIKEISYPTSKIDVKSTILQLLEIEDEFSLGFSVFTPKDCVSTNNNLIMTNKYFFDEKWYSLKTFEELDIDSLTEEEQNKLEGYKEEMVLKNDISKSIGYKNILEKK